jgi:predicted metal-dependent phosphoesterase TrpH
MDYRYETHCHSNWCSRCAHSSPEELVRAYHQKGFAGLVLTDHFIHGNTSVDPDLPWEIRMRRYYDAFLEAKALGDSLDFDVIFGLEHAYGGGLEALCYGIDLDFLLSNPDIPTLSIQAFAHRVHQWGGMVVQAHPYRSYCKPMDAALLDGVEVFNMHPNHNSRVALAAQQYGGKGLSLLMGTDYHHPGHHDLCATHMQTLPEDSFALAAALKGGDYILQLGDSLILP